MNAKVPPGWDPPNERSDQWHHVKTGLRTKQRPPPIQSAMETVSLLHPQLLRLGKYTAVKLLACHDGKVVSIWETSENPRPCDWRPAVAKCAMLADAAKGVVEPSKSGSRFDVVVCAGKVSESCFENLSKALHIFRALSNRTKRAVILIAFSAEAVAAHMRSEAGICADTRTSISVPKGASIWTPSLPPLACNFACDVSDKRVFATSDVLVSELARMSGMQVMAHMPLSDCVMESGMGAQTTLTPVVRELRRDVRSKQWLNDALSADLQDWEFLSLLRCHKMVLADDAVATTVPMQIWGAERGPTVSIPPGPGALLTWVRPTGKS